MSVLSVEGGGGGEVFGEDGEEICLRYMVSDEIGVRWKGGICLTRKAIRSAVVQRAVTALRVHGGFYDILGLAVVFLRELCDGTLEVFDFVDAGEVEDVVDLVCCEGWGVCGRHGWCMYTEST